MFGAAELKIGVPSVGKSVDSSSATGAGESNWRDGKDTVSFETTEGAGGVNCGTGAGVGWVN